MLADGWPSGLSLQILEIGGVKIINSGFSLSIARQFDLNTYFK